MSSTLRLFGLLCAAWAFPGCTHELAPDEAAETSPPPLFVAALDDGSTLEIYQASDGTILLSGETPAGVVPLSARYDLAVPVTDLYQRIFPGKPVPAVLVEAHRQEVQALRDRPESPEVATELDAALDHTSREVDEANQPRATAVAFADTHCDTARLSDQPRRPLRHLNWCRTNWSGGFHSGAFNNVRQGYSAVDATSGNVTFQRNWRVTGSPDWTITSWAVNQGTTRWAEAHSGSDAVGVDAFFQVLNASGDAFHASAMWANRLSCHSLGTVCVGFPTGCWVEFHRCNDGTEPTSSCLGLCTP
jgi:hypothetical protein